MVLLLRLRISLLLAKASKKNLPDGLFWRLACAANAHILRVCSALRHCDQPQISLVKQIFGCSIINNSLLRKGQVVPL